MVPKCYKMARDTPKTGNQSGEIDTQLRLDLLFASEVPLRSIFLLDLHYFRYDVVAEINYFGLGG